MTTEIHTSAPPKSQTSLPVPDPTPLTTDNLLREIRHLKDLLEEKLEATKKLCDLRFDAAEKSISRADVFVEKRFDSIVEFRAAFNDLVARQMPRVEAETRIDALADKLDSRLGDMTKKEDELHTFSAKAFMIGSISLLVSTISVLITLVTFLKLY